MSTTLVQRKTRSGRVTRSPQRFEPVLDEGEVFEDDHTDDSESEADSDSEPEPERDPKDPDYCSEEGKLELSDEEVDDDDASSISQRSEDEDSD
jgi:hypothetical protein